MKILKVNLLFLSINNLRQMNFLFINKNNGFMLNLAQSYL